MATRTVFFEPNGQKNRIPETSGHKNRTPEPNRPKNHTPGSNGSNIVSLNLIDPRTILLNLMNQKPFPDPNEPKNHFLESNRHSNHSCEPKGHRNLSRQCCYGHRTREKLIGVRYNIASHAIRAVSVVLPRFCRITASLGCHGYRSVT